MDQDFAKVSATYLRFAEDEARGRSPLYEQLTRGIAADRQTIEFLLTLPRPKRQPNLLLAAVRHLFGTPKDWPHFRQMVAEHREAVRAAMLEHSTQTNEPGRCATLLPLLLRLPQPLALLEVGASAGLCLLPDLYGYDLGEGLLRPPPSKWEPPIFSCAVNAATPVPTELPCVVWRAGLDLNPLSVSDRAHLAWLETLVWPEQTDRLARLRAAIAIAAGVKPRIVKGDLRHDLAPLAAQAPQHATLVVFHTAALGYVSPAADREKFAREVGSLCDYWICNEVQSVFPAIAQRANPQAARNQFLLSLNGEPMAWTDPHGASMEWIGERIPPSNRS